MATFKQFLFETIPSLPSLPPPYAFLENLETEGGVAIPAGVPPRVACWGAAGEGNDETGPARPCVVAPRENQAGDSI